MGVGVGGVSRERERDDDDDEKRERNERERERKKNTLYFKQIGLQNNSFPFCIYRFFLAYPERFRAAEEIERG